MYQIPGCSIQEKIFESPNTLIYRGSRRQQTDNQPIILKILKEDYPSPEELVRYRQEYEITKNLEINGVIKAYGQEKYGNTLAIILEDIGGESLKIQHKRRPFTLIEILQLAVRISGILGALHDAQVIHKDINPSNIVYNPGSDELKLIDFGISTKLSREMPVLKNPERLEGTLAYISPEQTGRMNRSLDYRTDFYALGVTLYELLTGSLPFPTQDPLELTHCHLAREATAPDRLNPEISKNLSQVVLKLLAKRAEDRYQTTGGLVADLEYCLRELESKSVDATFTPGTKDISSIFQLPQKLYGRETELKALWSGAKRAAEGRSEALFVAGYSGVGKSALVKELYRTLISPEARHGYFITGKFDQYHRDIPYSAARDAFRDLIRQLLTESEERLSAWKKDITEALGPNGRIMTEPLPELELIIGEQPPVPQLDAGASRNRFTLVIRNFVEVFLRRDTPLVIFLDDLQWADLASLELIKLITTKSNFLFLIGAYRDNEVRPGHPLLMTIDEMREENTLLDLITLPPLELDHIQRFVSDATRRNISGTNDLAKLLKHKTAGNPFFLGEFLKTMERKGLLTFHNASESWSWEIARVQEQNITDNVVELIAEHLGHLDKNTKSVLSSAACLGNTFTLETLALLHEKSPTETALDLWPALELNILLPLHDEYKTAALAPLNIPSHKNQTPLAYKFAHDRIEEASYGLLSTRERQARHRKAGRLLLDNSSDKERKLQIFEIVDHLNIGQELLENQEERDEAARLNLQAGLKAHTSGAFGPALGYFKTGLELLRAGPESSWRRAYQLTLTLTTRAAEAAMMKRDFPEMELHAKEVLKQAANTLDCTQTYEIQIQAFTVRNDFPSAIKTSLLALKKLGINLPEKSGKVRFFAGLLLTKLRLARKTPEDILNLPQAQDPTTLAASRILDKLFNSAYHSAPGLLALIFFQQVKLALRYGNTNETPTGFNGYGLVLSDIRGDVKGGYKYGKLAMELMEHLNIVQTRAKIMLVYTYLIQHWNEPLRKSIRPLQEAHKIALETGDLEIAAHGLNCPSVCAFWSGSELGELEKVMEIQAETISRLGQKTALNYLNINLQALKQLRLRANDPTLLVGDAYNETNMLPVHKQAEDISALFCVYFYKLILSYIFQAPLKLTLQHANETGKFQGTMLGSPELPVFYFYDSLARLATFPQASRAEQKHIRKKVKGNQKKLSHWAHHAPMNQLHRVYLVNAEEARVLGHPNQARALYDQAIQQARDNDYINDEALAWEVAGRFYQENGPLHLARHYLNNARYAYSRWGADAKVTALENTYPEIWSNKSNRLEDNNSTISTSHRDSGSLDLDAIIKASQAIAGEIRTEALVKKLMSVVLENTGAEKGFLIQVKDKQYHIQAREEVNSEGGFIAWGPDQQPITDESKLPLSILAYTMRTRQVLVLSNAQSEGEFTGSEYIRKHQVASVLCVPVRKKGRVIGLLYLENNLTPGAFTANHVEIIHILSTQIEMSIENAFLYSNLEEKVKERTEQLETALGDVRALKNRQDGDYYLTANLLKPLCENTATGTHIQSDILIKQYKQFKFEKWDAELGGDMCACHDLTLRGKTYTLFLNADAMGKSMQGAGGSLVLLAALKTLLEKVNNSPLLQDQSPESWLSSAYIELHQVFATFNGFMQVTLIMGLADGENKRLYFLNAEHPLPVLYRRNEADYFSNRGKAQKLGDTHLYPPPPLNVEQIDLKSGDIILLGSDGKDDLQMGLDEEGHRIISNDDNIFLECVEEAQGEPDKIMKSLESRGTFIDDFSLLRLRVI